MDKLIKLSELDLDLNELLEVLKKDELCFETKKPFYDKLNAIEDVELSKWIAVCLDSTPGSLIEEYTLYKIIDKEKTIPFEALLEVYGLCKAESRLQPFIVSVISGRKSMITMSQWINASKINDNGGKLYDACIAGIREKNSSFIGLVNACLMVKPNTLPERILIGRLVDGDYEHEANGISLKRLVDAYIKCSEASKVANFIYNVITKYSGVHSEWLCVLKRQNLPYKLRIIAIGKLEAMEATRENWLEFLKLVN